MAVGWARDGAVQDQIDASVNDAVSLARSRLPRGESRQQRQSIEVTPFGFALPVESDSDKSWTIHLE
jgi:hypothetical protein